MSDLFVALFVQVYAAPEWYALIQGIVLYSWVSSAEEHLS